MSRQCKKAQISSTAIKCTMNLSSVYNRMHYLVTLRNAHRVDRITMLRNITAGQLVCIGEIAHKIYNQTVLTRDLNDFEDRSLVLRSLFSDCVSFGRKVTTLIHYHTMIPSLLRKYYRQATIQDQIRSQQES